MSSPPLKLRITIPGDLELGRYLQTLTAPAMRHELIRLASNGLKFDSAPVAAMSTRQAPTQTPTKDVAKNGADILGAGRDPTDESRDKSDTTETDGGLIDFGSQLSEYLG